MSKRVARVPPLPVQRGGPGLECGGLSGVSSGQDENVGSFNVTRGGWQRERERVRQGGGRGPGVVIYEVSKTLYTPTRQRAGLAPRNPVLALTHRYLSHDHFRPIRARAALHTGIHEAKPRLPPRS